MLAWVDVETTGLDPAGGSLLEVAFITTDDDLRVISQLEMVIGVEPDTLEQHLSTFTREMHTRNGLLEAVSKEIARCDGQPSLREAEQKLLMWFHPHEQWKQVPLAGSSVSFDRAWLKAHMPLVEALFSYRNVDVSTVKELCKRWAPQLCAMRPKGETPAHRALADVFESVKELGFYRRQFLHEEVTG